MPPYTLCNLIEVGLVEEHTAKDACTAFGLLGGYWANEYSILTTLICRYHF
jgi:hypothetical protein